MTRASATPPSGADQRPGWRSTLRDPALGAIAIYAAVAVAAAIAAYLAIFTVWAKYDDEGTLLVTLQAFAQGETLYRDVYSPYGPFYFEVFGGLFALSGQAVTTNASRSIVIVLWVATSFMFGLAAHRVTGRLMLGVAAMIAAFSTLYVLVNEPMHPQLLCAFLLGAFVLLAVLGPTRRPQWAGAAGGALLAALLLTKVNLGAYAIAAALLAISLTIAPLRGLRWPRWLAVAGVIALPLVVAGRDLDLNWVRNMVAVEVLTVAAVAIAAWPLGSRSRSDDDDGSVRWLLGAGLGFVVSFIAILAAIVLSGSSPSDIYEGVITEALRVRDVAISEFQMSPAVVDWSVLAVAAAALSLRFRSGEGAEPAVWPGLLRAAVGLAIWLSVAKIAVVGLNPSAGNPVSVAAVLAWVAAVPPAGSVEGPYMRFVRVLLPALAVTQALQVYPIAGSQMGIAALTFVPVGAVCLADALASLRRWSAARGGHAPERLGAAVAVVSVAFAAIFAINAIVRPIADSADIYRAREPLPFAGADQMRPDPVEAQSYIQLVDLLRRYRCTDFVGYPNVNSLYLWSGIDPPPPYAPGAWIQALDSERQQRIVDRLRASPRPCAIRNDALANVWLLGESPPDRPLVNYLFDEFQPVAEAGDFQFMLPIEADSGRSSSG